MKLRNVFLASGTLVLAGSAFLANAKKPFSVVTKLFYTVSSACRHFTVVGNQFTTGSVTAVQASLRTQGTGARVTLWGGCTTTGGVTTLTNKVNFHP